VTYADNVAKLLGALESVADADRTARFRTVALLRFPDGREIVGDGVIEGHIARHARGDGGFGYDPIFVPDESDGRSFAEMDAEEKHAISHRGRALRALAAKLSPSAS
jgi:XTP/dITP diphosphohydrolase